MFVMHVACVAFVVVALEMKGGKAKAVLS